MPPTDTTQAVAPPQGPPPPQQRPAFWRSSTDKVVGGVAAGLARTFDMDAVVVRIITVVICIAFPPAFAAYLAAWLLVARDDRSSRTLVAGVAIREPGGVGFWLGVVVVVGIGVATLDAATVGGGYGLLPLLLIGIGVALWSRGAPSLAPATSSTAASSPPAGGDAGTAATAPAASPVRDSVADDRPSGPASPVPASSVPAPTVPASSGQPSTAPAPSGQPSTVGTPPGPPPASPSVAPEPASVPPPEPAPPRERSPLGAITIALALITTGVVAVLDMVEGVPLDADPTELAAVALLVLGLGQLVGALWGRARWLSLVALLLLPPVLAGAGLREIEARTDLAQGLDIADGIGQRRLDPIGPGGLPEEIRLLAGQVTVDLLLWEPPDRAALDRLATDDSDLTISVGAGEVVLVTPAAVPWRVVGDVGLGDVSVSRNATLLERSTTQALDQPLEVLRTGGPQDGPVLDIVVDLRVGELDLHTPPFDREAWDVVQDGRPVPDGTAPRTDRSEPAVDPATGTATSTSTAASTGTATTGTTTTGTATTGTTTTGTTTTGTTIGAGPTSAQEPS